MKVKLVLAAAALFLVGSVFLAERPQETTAALRSDEKVFELLELLADSNPENRIAATVWLEKLTNASEPGDAVRSGLSTHLLLEDHPEVRRRIVQTLARSGGVEDLRSASSAARVQAIPLFQEVKNLKTELLTDGGSPSSEDRLNDTILKIQIFQDVMVESALRIREVGHCLAIKEDQRCVVDLRELPLKEFSFIGRDLSDSDFSDAALWEADFTDAYLDRSDFSGAELLGVSFENASLKEAVFRDSDLSPVPWDPTNTAKTKTADSHRASFANANLRGAHFENMSLEGVSFDGANLANSEFRCVSGADLSKATGQPVMTNLNCD